MHNICSRGASPNVVCRLSSRIIYNLGSEQYAYKMSELTETMSNFAVFRCHDTSKLMSYVVPGIKSRCTPPTFQLI